MNLKLTAQARLEILQFLAEGHTVTEACERWGVSLSTIKRLKQSVKPLISTNARLKANTVSKASQVTDTEVTDTEVTDTEVTDTELEIEFRLTAQNLDNFLYALKPRLVRKALEILDGAHRTTDQLKALDLLAKWTGLNLGDAEKIQRQIAEEVERRVEAEVRPLVDAVREDTILSESARDRIREIAGEIIQDSDMAYEACIEMVDLDEPLQPNDYSACFVTLTSPR